MREQKSAYKQSIGQEQLLLIGINNNKHGHLFVNSYEISPTNPKSLNFWANVIQVHTHMVLHISQNEVTSVIPPWREEQCP
jgi:hypothetical protein